MYGSVRIVAMSSNFIYVAELSSTLIPELKRITSQIIYPITCAIDHDRFSIPLIVY